MLIVTIHAARQTTLEVADLGGGPVGGVVLLVLLLRVGRALRRLRLPPRRRRLLVARGSPRPPVGYSQVPKRTLRQRFSRTASTLACDCAESLSRRALFAERAVGTIAILWTALASSEVHRNAASPGASPSAGTATRCPATPGAPPAHRARHCLRSSSAVHVVV